MLLSVTCLLLTTLGVKAQKAEKYFNKSDLMLFGTYYYPEQWPKDNWARDISRISKLGFNFTHFGEFAWAAMEPEEGKYDFSWLDEAVSLAGENHIKVIMCTPTPTPPAWLVRKHPDVLIMNADGRVVEHGARQQASWSSDLYKKYVDGIVTQLAKRYGHNKVIMGWQIDNEPSHYGEAFDYSENAQQKFRKWLEAKYKNIAELNSVWGNSFWSQMYNDFDQIRIPNQKELVQGVNPHALLDFKRFTADEAASFVVGQQTVLRKYISDDQWVTTNVMADYSPVDPARMSDLDFLTYTKYLVAGFEHGTGEQGFRMGSSLAIGFANDYIRPITGVTGVMEIQPGQVNWGQYNPQTMPGIVHTWIMNVFSGGNKFVCNYRFREPLFGGEQYHYGIMKPDGITVSRTGEEFLTSIKEVAKLRKAWNPNAVMPAEMKARKTAMLYNPDNRWETEDQPQTNQWSFFGHFMKYYGVLKSLGSSIDVIDEKTDFNKYPVMVAPAYQLLDRNLIARWKAYVEQGGNLVITSRTGQKDRNAHLWEAKFAEPIYDLAGIKEVSYDVLPWDYFAKVSMGGQTYSWNNWGDILHGAPDANKLAVYADQFYKGEAAVVTRKLGKGTVTYIGPDTDDGKLERDIMKKVYANAHIPAMDLPAGVIVDWRDGFWIGMNYSSTNQPMPVPVGAKILVGSKVAPPAGTTVWQ